MPSSPNRHRIEVDTPTIEWLRGVAADSGATVAGITERLLDIAYVLHNCRPQGHTADLSDAREEVLSWSASQLVVYTQAAEQMAAVLTAEYKRRQSAQESA